MYTSPRSLCPALLATFASSAATANTKSADSTAAPQQLCLRATFSKAQDKLRPAPRVNGRRALGPPATAQRFAVVLADAVAADGAVCCLRVVREGACV